MAGRVAREACRDKDLEWKVYVSIQQAGDLTGPVLLASGAFSGFSARTSCTLRAAPLTVFALKPFRVVLGIEFSPVKKALRFQFSARYVWIHSR